VKNLMALGKLLTLTVMFASIVGCAAPMGQSYLQSGSIRDTTDYESVGSIVSRFEQLGTELGYRLSDQQKTKQTHAVYAALESNYGTVYTWYEGNARGAVKAVHGYPNWSGFCRVVYSQVEKNGEVRTFEETACTRGTNEQWRFKAME